MESADLVIVGAGWSGLAALKTHHQIHPDASIVLLESASSVGGVWAQHRLYAGLKSNNMLGTYEFSDFPMDSAQFGVQPGEHIPGAVIQKYMEAFVAHFGLGKFIRLNTAVQTATKTEHNNNNNGWELTTSSSTNPGQGGKISAAKLIVATGITSQPFLPSFPGQEDFQRPLFHTHDLPAHQDALLTPDSHITVLGGTKSAWDAVYAAATAGCAVDWIIRDNGHGPVWMAPAYVTPLTKWLEKLVTTRLLTWFSPCIWAGYPAATAGKGKKKTNGKSDNDSGEGFLGRLMRSFLHGTWVGRKITDAFWGILAADVVGLNNYDAHPETAKLKPWISPFWIASSLSILNYPTDFFELVRSGSVRVHIARIERLGEDGEVVLRMPEGKTKASPSPEKSPETTISTSALICSTGWQATPPITFQPACISDQLGFPWQTDPIPASMVEAANKEIQSRYPRLAQPPPPYDSPSPSPSSSSSSSSESESASFSSPYSTPYSPLAPNAPATAPHPIRMARFMVPPSFVARGDRSLAFMGLAMTINTTMLAQAQALWIAAFFDGEVELSTRVAERCPLALKEEVRKSKSKRGEEKEKEEEGVVRVDEKQDGDDDGGEEGGDEVDVLWETALHTQFGVHRCPGGFGRRNPDFVFDAVSYMDLLLGDLGLDAGRKSGLRRYYEPYGMEDYRGLVEEWMQKETK